MLDKTDGKAWYQSVGIWGGIVAVITPLLDLGGKLGGWEISLDNDGGGLVAALVAAAGGLAAVYGRVNAKRVIK